MTFIRKSGRTKLFYLPKASAVTIKRNSILKFNVIGGVIDAVGDTNEPLVGVSRDSYATSDTTTKLIPVEVPIELGVEWEFTTDSDGGLTDTMIGTFRDLDTTGANVDASATSRQQILVTGKISSTKGIGVIARGVWYNSTPVQATT